MVITTNKVLLGLLGVASIVLAMLLAIPGVVSAQSQTESGAIGLEGTIPSPPPTVGATITIPGNGQVFTQIPITVQGTCPNDLLVKLFKNNIFAGSAQCNNGSFSIVTDLFAGENELVARVYDDLDQAGPDSNKPVVTYNDANFGVFGPPVSLTSDLAKRGTDPGEELDWPIILSGGQGPYAISVNWGDGSEPDLFTRDAAGGFTITHTYDSPGFYNILIKATDRNGSTAYLQLVGVANGPGAQIVTASSESQRLVIVKVIWWPAAVAIPLILATFWLGRRHELFMLRKRLERRETKKA